MSGHLITTKCIGCKKSIYDHPMRCSGCKSVYYCNQDCQKAHWAQHKDFCKIRQAEYASGAQHTNQGMLSPESARNRVVADITDRCDNDIRAAIHAKGNIVYIINAKVRADGSVFDHECLMLPWDEFQKSMTRFETIHGNESRLAIEREIQSSRDTGKLPVVIISTWPDGTIAPIITSYDLH
jgi:hypothetical protein